MRLTFVLRNKKNALKLSTKSLESFVERIQTDTKDGAVARRRKQLTKGDYIDGYDRQYPSHLIYPSAEFEKDDNDNLRMKAFNGVVALTVENLDSQAEIDAVKRAAQILHYTLAAFVGPSGNEVIILVKIAKSEDDYSTISSASAAISGASSEISSSYLTEEEADVLCREGHRLASAIYQAILPKAIRQETISVRSCFRMPLDAHPYMNAKAVALPVSEKPLQALNNQPLVATEVSPETEEDEDQDDASINISRQTMQLIDFLNQRYQFRYNTIMGYTEYKDNNYQYMDWQPVDDRALKGLTMKVRLGGIDAHDNDVRRYVQSDMIHAYHFRCGHEERIRTVVAAEVGAEAA